MSRQPRQYLRQCQRCGQAWTVLQGRGRLPVVCPACRAAHEAALAAARMRRSRHRAQERTADEADILARRVAWYADRLLAEHPDAARVLAEVPYDLAEALVDDLKERLRATDAQADAGAADDRAPGSDAR
jgi:hypothetical protein